MEQQQPQSPADAGHYDEDDDGGGEYDGDGDAQMGGLGHRDERSQMVKNLVRYALACEYSRTPIRRDGIRDKGIDTNRSQNLVLTPSLTNFSARCQRARVQKGVCRRTEAVTGDVWHGDGRAANQGQEPHDD